jgi:hypothetical protein
MPPPTTDAERAGSVGKEFEEFKEYRSERP